MRLSLYQTKERTMYALDVSRDGRAIATVCTGRFEDGIKRQHTLWEDDPIITFNVIVMPCIWN